MKKFIPVLLFVIVPLFYSCISREQANYTPATAAINGLNNGESWKAILTDTLVNDSMILNAQWKHQLLRIKFLASGKNYTLTGQNGRYYNTDNLGKIVTTYKLDNTYTNTVTNITVNPNNKYYTGQFKMRFVIDSLALNTDTIGVDSTVTFTNGSFTAPYK